MSSRRGFTLVELMVALGLGLLVGGLVHRFLLQGQRLARAQAERLALHENVRVAALVIAGELGGIGYDEITAEAAAALGYPAALRSDLLSIAPGAVSYLAGRGEGRVCAASPGPPAEIVVADASWESLRSPRATDSLLVFVESDPTTGADDAWIHLGIVSAGAGSCPGGQPGMVLGVAAPPSLDLATLARVTAGSSARLAEVMQLRYYQSGGKSWFGMRSVSTGEAVTPVAGPLADSSAGVRGLTLTYRGASDAPTTDPAAVRAVEIALLGVTDQPVHGRSVHHARVDSFALNTRVALRNALRP
jgi:prepilin-type N-terminal cleavage/methylation domain-containing protein